MARSYKRFPLNVSVIPLKKPFEFFVSKSRIFDYGFERIGVQPFMVCNSYSVRSIGHADVLTSVYNFESGFGKCPDSPFGGNISEKHFRLEPRPDKRWLPLFLPLSVVDKL